MTTFIISPRAGLEAGYLSGSRAAKQGAESSTKRATNVNMREIASRDATRGMASKVERLLSRIIRNQSEIDDVSQEAFIKAYRAIGSFRGDSAFYTWLYRIAVNTAKNYLIGQGRRAPTSTGYDAEEAENFEDATGLRDMATPDSLLMSKQIGEIVNRTIDALPNELRTAITLREIEGLSYEEIAQIMDCPIGTVRSRIFRAREAVAVQLRPQLGTDKDTRW